MMKKFIIYYVLAKARKNAEKISQEHQLDKPSLSELPSKCESCTTVYKFFDEVDERLKELK